jgi:hypothetical protein
VLFRRRNCRDGEIEARDPSGREPSLLLPIAGATLSVGRLTSRSRGRNLKASAAIGLPYVRQSLRDARRGRGHRREQ